MLKTVALHALYFCGNHDSYSNPILSRLINIILEKKMHLFK